MKKNLLICFLAGILSCGSLSTAFAQEINMGKDREAAAAEAEQEFGEDMTTEEVALAIDESMIDESVYEGTWISAFDVFKLYLPNDWTVWLDAKTAEEADENTYFQAGSEGSKMNLAISYMQGGGDLTNEVLRDVFLETGYESADIWAINGIPCVVGAIDEYLIVSSIGYDGGVYTISIYLPDEEEKTVATAYNILYSFQAVDAKAPENEAKEENNK